MTDLAPIPELKVRLTIRQADRNGRRRSYGKIQFAYDGTMVTASNRRGDLIASGQVVSIKETGPERWDVLVENGDIWEAVRGCGCGH